MTTRRDFLARTLGGSSLLAVGSVVPEFLANTALAADKDDTAKTQAFVTIQNAVPGGEHPWHVHVGACGNDRGILGPPGAYEPLQVGGGGMAQENAVLPVPAPVAGQYFVNVHASRNNMSTIIACGNLAPPSR